MGIQILLNKGGANRCLLEKAGDLFNAPARYLWLHEKISVQKSTDSNHAVLNKEIRKLPTPLCKDADGQLILEPPTVYHAVVGIIYLAVSIVVSIPLGIGLLLKKIAIKTDQKSKAYNLAVQKFYELEKSISEKNQIVKTIKLNDKVYRDYQYSIIRYCLNDKLKDKMPKSSQINRRASFSNFPPHHKVKSDEFNLWKNMHQYFQAEIEQCKQVGKDFKEKLKSKQDQITKIKNTINEQINICGNK